LYDGLLVTFELQYLQTILFILVFTGRWVFIFLSLLPEFCSRAWIYSCLDSVCGVRERLEYSNIPESFKGLPIALISAAFVSLAFFGFQGLLGI